MGEVAVDSLFLQSPQQPQLPLLPLLPVLALRALLSLLPSFLTPWSTTT